MLGKNRILSLFLNSFNKFNKTFVLLFYRIYLTRCEKEIKCSVLLLFPTCLINSIKHEHSCKILYKSMFYINDMRLQARLLIILPELY